MVSSTQHLRQQPDVEDLSRATSCAVLGLSAAAWLIMWSGTMGHNTPVAASTLSVNDQVVAEATRRICGMPPAMGTPLNVKLQWLAGWAIMVMAMMLPPALPFLRTVSEVVGRQALWLIALAGFAFVTGWVCAGAVLVILAWALSAMSLPLMIDAQMVAGIAALIVGLYQFTPLKRACLDACRSPRAVLLCHWNGDAPARSAMTVGLRYAAICIGCCWATMLLTLLVGAYALPLMVIVSVIMLAERLLPAVRPLVPIQAALAIAIGVFLMVGIVPTQTIFVLG